MLKIVHQVAFATVWIDTIVTQYDSSSDVVACEEQNRGCIVVIAK